MVTLTDSNRPLSASPPDEQVDAAGSDVMAISSATPALTPSSAPASEPVLVPATLSSSGETHTIADLEAAGATSAATFSATSVAAANRAPALTHAGVATRLAREVSSCSVEIRLLTHELSTIDAAREAVSLRLARRMAMVAKRELGGGGGGGLSLGVGVGSSKSNGGGGAAGSGGCSEGGRGDLHAADSLDGCSDEQLRARLVSERAVHATLVEQQTDRRVKWERLVETVATLPLDSPSQSPLRRRMPRIEPHLRLGATYHPAWRLPQPDADGSGGSGGGSGGHGAAVPVVIMVDVQHGALRLVEEGVEKSAVPFAAVPSLFPGYRASHYRSAGVGHLPKNGSGAAGVPGAPPPSESCCFCLPGVRSAPPVPLHTGSPRERDFLFAAWRAAAALRPLTPHHPLHAGALMREPQRGSLYWSLCHAVLLPDHLLLLATPEDAFPFRSLALHGAAIYHRPADRSLVFTLRGAGWHATFSAKDAAAHKEWLDALKNALPIGTVADDGTLGRLRRRPRVVDSLADLSSARVAVRALQRSVAEAEARLASEQSAADAAVARAINQVQHRGTPVRGKAKDGGGGSGGGGGGGAILGGGSGGNRGRSSLLGSMLGNVVSASNGTILGSGYDGGCESPDAIVWGHSGPPSPALPAVEKPPSDPHSMLRQLQAVNRSLTDETSDGDAEIRMLQRAVLLLSEPDWTRGEWLWFVRVAGARTLWEVWCRAYALHCVQQQRRAAAAAAEAAALKRRFKCGVSSKDYFRDVYSGGDGFGRSTGGGGSSAPDASAALATPADTAAAAGGGTGAVSALSQILSTWRGSHGLGVDETKTVNADTRRQAAIEHDEDWFIHWTNRVFEI